MRVGDERKAGPAAERRVWESRGPQLPAGARRVLVIGASRSGLAAASALRGLGRQVVLSDQKHRQDLPGLDALERQGVTFFLGEPQVEEQLEGVDLVIKSPGIPEDNPLIHGARRRRLPVWSEVELAFALLPNPFDAVTGTNGKTTTTALLGHIFAVAGRPSRVLGNIGTATTSVIGQVGEEEELVVELSSFQLEDVHSFRPSVGIFLNFTPDHLDRHGTMQRYLECKAKMFQNQGPDDTAILNLDDQVVRELGTNFETRPGGPRVLYFSAQGQPAADARLNQGWLWFQGRKLLRREEFPLPGRHNVENGLAAGLAALARGLPADGVVEGLRTFPGVPHRLQWAGEVRGVTYVNDSKATNVDATLTALAAYQDKTVHLILGGRDKASDYHPLARACARICRAVYLIGEAAPLIGRAFEEVRVQEGLDGVPEPRQCGDLQIAVEAAGSLALPGDVVLLSPACASFDQYRDFEQRGERFISIVQSLAGIGG